MSKTQFKQLFAGLKACQNQSPPGSLRTAEFPEVGTLPLPEETWTLIDLVRHHERQQWLGQVVRKNLKRKRGHGVVPGLIDWEYNFHGIGCELTHRVTGEQIDVDFHGKAVDTIDVWFYVKFLGSLRQPDVVAQRVLDLHPNRDAVVMDAINMVRQGVLVQVLALGTGLVVVPKMGAKFTEGFDAPVNTFQLLKVVLQSRDVVSCFCKQWEDESRRLWLAAMIGDWPLVSSLCSAGGSCSKAFAEVAQSRATACRRNRLEEISEFQKNAAYGHLAIAALESFPRSTQDQEFVKVLKGPISGATSRVMEMIIKMNDPSWCQHVLELLDRLDPRDGIPVPAVYGQCLGFLLTHGYQKAHVVEKLFAAGDGTLHEASLLALEHAPTRALPLIRRGLRCDTPYVRHEITAMLAILDSPWSRKELLAALNETNDVERSAVYARAHLARALIEAVAKRRGFGKRSALTPTTTSRGRLRRGSVPLWRNYTIAYFLCDDWTYPAGQPHDWELNTARVINARSPVQTI